MLLSTFLRKGYWRNRLPPIAKWVTTHFQFSPHCSEKSENRVDLGNLAHTVSGIVHSVPALQQEHHDFRTF
jgi:hypothetical protein